MCICLIFRLADLQVGLWVKAVCRTIWISVSCALFEINTSTYISYFICDFKCAFESLTPAFSFDCIDLSSFKDQYVYANRHGCPGQKPPAMFPRSGKWFLLRSAWKEQVRRKEIVSDKYSNCVLFTSHAELAALAQIRSKAPSLACFSFSSHCLSFSCSRLKLTALLCLSQKGLQ